MKGLSVLAVAVAVMCVAEVAAADPPAQPKPASTDQSYGYDFADDPLTALVGGSNIPLIRVRQLRVRRMLLRPRASFVPELLKSVERL
ncbi:MAG: hypothetical protein HY908_06855 [Myxococcales bacterium]|nr:hypothetical protein [Myxococcales bacterium]